MRRTHPSGIRDQLAAAAAQVGREIRIVTLPVDSGERVEVDAVVVDAEVVDAHAEGPWCDGESGRASALVVALVTAAEPGEVVGRLGRGADLVVPIETHGRVLLAAILALLRWRSRG